ncbi:MAG: hypothetical protein EP320_01545, partial [Rhodobacteraceae bacterium]
TAHPHPRRFRAEGESRSQILVEAGLFQHPVKLMMSAQQKWRKLDGQNRLPEIIQGVEFRDGVRQLQTAA